MRRNFSRRLEPRSEVPGLLLEDLRRSGIGGDVGERRDWWRHVDAADKSAPRSSAAKGPESEPTPPEVAMLWKDGLPLN